MNDARVLKDADVLKAIADVQGYLDAAWIVDGCLGNVWGCASCNAVRLRNELSALEREIKDNAGEEE